MKKYSEIERAYMEIVGKELAISEKVMKISGKVLIALVIGLIILSFLGGTSLILAIRLTVAVLIAIVYRAYDNGLNAVVIAPYKNALDVLSVYCNELEIYGFDASSYRKAITFCRDRISYIFCNPNGPIWNLNYDLDCLKYRVELLSRVMQENFDNYTGKPEDTEMVLKPYKVNLNKDCKYGLDYVWETIELACPVKKSEVQSNE